MFDDVGPVFDDPPAAVVLARDGVATVEEGIDPTVPTNFAIPRITEHDVSVPGPVDPSASEGIAGEKEGPPVTVPAPADGR